MLVALVIKFVLAALGVVSLATTSAASGPGPGDLYREYATHNGGDRDWRVTDKDAVITFDRAKAHLPDSKFQLVRGESNDIRDHSGTLWKNPYRMTWQTHWIPDQRPGDVALIDRIQDSRGYRYVTDPNEDLSLVRPDTTVKLYPAENVPEDFGVRVDETKACTFEIPKSAPLDTAVEAALYLRTWQGWDGHHDPIRVNDHAMRVDGKNHFYDYDLLSFPPSALRHGTNTSTMHSETEHRMLEVLWPGPAIVVRIEKEPIAIREATYQDREHFVVQTPRATYWLDKRAGGLSRLIDSEGNDWIHFKREPWDEYPASAASSFRGLPNLLHGGKEGGFGHPGWDRGTSKQIDDRTIITTSKSGVWKLKWTFHPDYVDLDVITDDTSRAFWFLYEGPIAGQWSPSQQYVATDTMPPTEQPHDFQAGDRLYDRFQWAYMGDRTTARVLAIAHRTADDQVDTFSHLGNTDEGLDSPDGMVVFGFGRGDNGIEPLLKGPQSFRIGLIESPGHRQSHYNSLRSKLDAW